MANTPTRREAGVVRFTDLVLAPYERQKQPEHRAGLKELGPFAALGSAEQRQQLRNIVAESADVQSGRGEAGEI